MGIANAILFFCDFGPELAPSVAAGRREEFAKFPEFQDERLRDLIPDPTSEKTFERSILDWSERETKDNDEHLQFVRSLLEVRFKEVIPRLREIRGGAHRKMIGDTAFEIRWQLGSDELILTANLGDAEVEKQFESARVIFTHTAPSRPSGKLSPWCVTWQIKENAK